VYYDLSRKVTHPNGYPMSTTTPPLLEEPFEHTSAHVGVLSTLIMTSTTRCFSMQEGSEVIQYSYPVLRGQNSNMTNFPDVKPDLDTSRRVVMATNTRQGQQKYIQ